MKAPKPILASFCEVYAYLQIGGGLIWAAYLLLDGQSLESLLALVGSLAVAIGVLGVGQCVEYLAASAFHTKRMADVLDPAGVDKQPVADPAEAMRLAGAPSALTNEQAIESMRRAQRASGYNSAAPVTPVSSEDPDVAAYLAAKKARGEE